MRFSVPINHYGDPRYPNAACFVDYVRALVDALRALGHEVTPPTTDGHTVDTSARAIVFGAQKMSSENNPSDLGSFAPESAILYNTEQTGAKGGDPGHIFDAVKTWRSRVVWDYSQENIRALRKLGCQRLVHCPVGYIDTMTRIPVDNEKEDVDVLFYGSVETPNRVIGINRTNVKVLDRGAILDSLRSAGLNVLHVFGVYSTDLDPYVQRAKVVLNLHYYQGAVHEIFRCSHLYANHKCVVTEDGGCDEELEDFARRASCYVPRKDLVEVCRHLVADRDSRRVQAERGFDAFSKTSMIENVRRALEQS